MSPIQIWLQKHVVLLLGGALALAASLLLVGAIGAWRTGRRLGSRPRPVLSFALALASLVGGAAGVLVFGGGLVRIVPAVRAQGGMVGQMAPPLAFSYVEDERPGSLSDFRGQVVLVNVWATWCPPCREEMPALDRLQEAYGPRGLVVLQISDEDRETLVAYLAGEPMSTRHGFTQPIPWPEFGRPTTFVIDRQGIVRRAIIGARDFAGFEREILEYL